MHFYLLSFLSVSFLMYHSFKQPPPVARSLWIRHFVITVAVSMLTSEETYAVLFSVTHPQRVMDIYYVPKGFAPDWLYFLLRVASMILGAIIWSKSFSLATRKPKARRVFLLAWPFYVVVFLVQSTAVAQAHGFVTSAGRFFAFYILSPALILFLGYLVDLHFRSPSSDDLFLSQKAA